MRLRGFEIVKDEFKKDTDNAILPIRGTKHSGGYDFSTPIDVVIPAHGKKLIWSNIKAYMQPNEVLTIHVRSSIGIKKGLRLANITAIIDQDYYSNQDNDGNIGICLVNDTNEDVELKAGERIVQGIFLPFLEADNGNTDVERKGGIGHTNGDAK